MPMYNQKTRKIGAKNYYSSSKFVNEIQQQSSDKIAKDYLATLLYPGGVTGVKIPDFNLYPTVTAHTEVEGTYNCSAGGDSNFLVRLHPGRGAGAVAGAGGAINLPNTATTSAAAFTYAANTDLRAQPAAFAASYSKCRLVSASIEVEYIGNDSNNQGRMAGCVLTRSEYLLANFDSFNEILSARDSMSVPVTKGIFLRYRPLDELSFNFVNLDDTTDTDPIDVIVASTGCAGGALCPFRYKISANWECVIKSDQYDQPIANMAALSPTNPQAMDQVKTILPSIGNIESLPASTVNKNESSGGIKAEAEASSMIDKLGAAWDYGSNALKGYAAAGPLGGAAAIAGVAARRGLQAKRKASAQRQMVNKAVQATIAQVNKGDTRMRASKYAKQVGVWKPY